jgi:hypothetical protein
MRNCTWAEINALHSLTTQGVAEGNPGTRETWRPLTYF